MIPDEKMKQDACGIIFTPAMKEDLSAMVSDGKMKQNTGPLTPDRKVKEDAGNMGSGRLPETGAGAAIPNWMMVQEEYSPEIDRSTFAFTSIKAIARAMARIRVQHGQEHRMSLPPLLKLLIMMGGVLLVSIAQNRLILLAYAAAALLSLSFLPAKEITEILRAALGGALLAAVLLLPAVLLDPAYLGNGVTITIKVFFSVLTVSIFNHTTQWNHITGAMRKLHVPGIFIFTIDITLKYIVVLGNLVTDLLTSLQLRAVGKNDRKYTTVGGVMGVTFVRGAEMNRQMYEAMQCRGFTDDYKGL